MPYFIRSVVYFVILLCLCQLSSIVAKDIGFFWQVSDFHYDANYSTDGDSSHMCHHGNSSSGDVGEFGNYLCDAPWTLITSAIQAMYKIKPNPDFIIWTGDSVPHVPDSELSEDKVYTLIGNVTSELMSVFPNTSIFPVLGNHDPYPENMMPYDVEASNYYKKILNRSQWSEVLGHNESQQFHNGGYYSSMVSDKLRIVGLNTNLYYSQDKLTKDLSDPANQLEWLEKQLQAARRKDEQVYIVAHVPPGMFELGDSISWFYASYNKKYLDITERYQDVIAVQLYGHEHTDSFRVQFDREGKAIGVMFLCPAVTPWKSTLPGVGANNPSIRLFKYDKQTGVPQSYIQYYLNLTAVNMAKSADNWQKEYDTSDVYAIDELRPTKVHTLLKGFTDKSNKLFRHYVQYNSVMWDPKPECNETCFQKHVCAISELDFNNFQTCLTGGKTTFHPPTTTHHHHTTPSMTVPGYMYYVIAGLAAVVFLLFIIIAILCYRRGGRVRAPKFAKFGSLSINDHV